MKLQREDVSLFVEVCQLAIALASLGIAVHLAFGVKNSIREMQKVGAYVSKMHAVIAKQSEEPQTREWRG